MTTRRQIVGAAAATVAAATAGESMAAAASSGQPQLDFAFEARVAVEQPMVVGPSSLGLRRIVPITGGTVDGPKLQGRVVPGGADWQFVRSDGVLVVEAKYTFEAADGTFIMVTNRGLRHGPPDVIAKLSRGEPVPASQYYFRTVPEFEAPAGSKHEWLNRSIFIGMAERQAGAAIIRVFQLL